MSTAHSGIKRRTRRAFYEFVAKKGGATKKEISEALDLSLPTVSKYLTHFLDAGLLTEGPKRLFAVSGVAVV